MKCSHCGYAVDEPGTRHGELLEVTDPALSLKFGFRIQCTKDGKVIQPIPRDQRNYGASNE